MLGSRPEALICTCRNTQFHIHYWRQFFPSTCNHLYFTISSSCTNYQVYIILQIMDLPQIYNFVVVREIVTDILPQRPVQLSLPFSRDLFQQVVFILWHLVPLLSVDCKDSQNQPDKRHRTPAPTLVSTKSTRSSERRMGLPLYHSHAANFVRLGK